jgi:peptidoglycan/LPS O-acetylase OafA/YrhL
VLHIHPPHVDEVRVDRPCFALFDFLRALAALGVIGIHVGAASAQTALGAISHGIFLWHGPLLNAMPGAGWDRWIPGSRFLSLAVAILPVAIACGWLSYRLVEQPAMRLARRSR